MELREGYKKTEIGVIPVDWEVKKLGDYVKISSGESPSKFVFKYSGIPYFKVEQLNNCNKYQKETPYFIETNNTIRKGSIIFPKRGASILLNKIRILAYDSFMDTNLMTLALSDELSNEFLFYVLSYFELWRIADTTSIPQINNKHITPFQIPLPPLPEQKAIAEVLSDTDNLIQALEKRIAKKRLIKQGAMQKLLMPKDDWEVKKLGEIGKCYRGVSYKGDTDLFLHDNDFSVRLLRSNNIQEAIIDINGLQYVNEEKVKPIQYIEPNDIVICMANGSKELVGKAAIFKINDSFTYTFGAFMGCFKTISQEVDKKYIFSNFLTFQYRNFIEFLLSGSSINNLKPSDIEDIEIPFPPKKEQTHIATILSDMDAEIEKLESKLAKYKQLKQGLMQNLLTGEIRLI